jgi:hypothetical protein
MEDEVKKNIDLTSRLPSGLPSSPRIVGHNNGSGDMYRSTKPHMAIVTMKVDIRAMNPDGTLDLHVMGSEALKKYNIGQKAQFVVKGTSEAKCIDKLKKLLERISDGER